MALYVTRPRRDEERIGRGLPSECIRCKGKVFEKWKINIGKHELVDSADAYKDGGWQEI